MNDTPVSLLIAGHSHAAALGVPLRLGTREPYLTDLAIPGADVVTVSGSWPRDADYWDMFVARASGRHPVLSWHGNQHCAHFLFAPDPPIDFVLSSAPDLPMQREAAWIPETLLRTYFSKTFAKLPALTARLKETTEREVVIVGTPPPKGDEAKVRLLLDRERYFVNAATAQGADLATIALTAPMVLLKLWTLVQDMMREESARIGAIFIAVPDTLRTKEGFLPEEYWSRDVTHANAAFGRAFVEHVVAVLPDLVRRPERVS